MSDSVDGGELNLRRLAIDHRQRPTGAASGRGLLLWISLAVLLLGAAAAWWYYRTTGRNIVAAFAERPIDVTLMSVPTPAARAPEVALVATGRIVSDRRVNVATKVSGQITELNVEQGDQVAAGQVLARIEDVVYKAERDQAQATLARFGHELARARSERIRAEAAVAESQAGYEFERRNFERLERLRRADQASEQEFLDARNRFEAAAAALEMTRAAVESAVAAVAAGESQIAAGEAGLALFQKRLDDCAIRAPIAGVILERNAEIGDFLAAEGGRGANANAQLVSIADMSLLRVEIDVSERDIGRVFRGQRARITPDASRERVFDGHVLWVDPIGDYAKATVQVKVRIENPTPELRIEGSAKVEFERPGLDAASGPAGGAAMGSAAAPSSGLVPGGVAPGSGAAANSAAAERSAAHESGAAAASSASAANGGAAPAIWLPKSAVKLTPGSDEAVVFGVVGERAVAHAVRIGARTDTSVEVLSGAYGGMQIVAEGVADLTDGALVRVRAGGP